MEKARWPGPEREQLLYRNKVLLAVSNGTPPAPPYFVRLRLPGRGSAISSWFSAQGAQKAVGRSHPVDPPSGLVGQPEYWQRRGAVGFAYVNPQSWLP